MDKIDLKIISLLQENARLPLKQIASEVFLSSPATASRIERLEQTIRHFATPHHLRSSPHLCDGTQTRGCECCFDLRIARTLEYPNHSNLSRLLRKLAD